MEKKKKKKKKTKKKKKKKNKQKKNLARIRSQEKVAVSPKETKPNLPVSVQESLAEVWVEECNSACISSFEGGCNYLISLASGKLWQTKLRQTKLRQTKQLHPSMENWIKDLPGMTPPIRTTP